MNSDLINDLERVDYKNSRPHPIGRPPVLNEDMIEQICDLLIQGQTMAKSAILTGISESTFYRWLALGKRSGAEPIYAKLVERVQEATECSRFELLQQMRIAGQNPVHWRSNAWMLERRFPEDFARKTQTSVQKEGNEPGVNSVGLTVVV